ncbi:hypothetical protein ACVWYF_000718 [Hymenobacter sp. UYAg731]
MKHFFTTRLLACLVVLLGLWPSLTMAAPFTPGNLVVVRIGDGSATAPASGSAVATFLLEYTPAGVLVQTIALPVADAGTNQTLTNTSSSSSEAVLTRSADGRYLVVTGYDTAPGTAAVVATASATTSRIIGLVAADGTVNTSTAISDAFSAGNIRSAATVDGTNFYAVGSNTGVRYLPLGSTGTSTALTTAAPTNNRAVNIFGGNLYVSAASGTFQGVSQVGTGLPTTGPQTITQLPGFPTATGPQPYAFFFADLSTAVAGVDVLYLTDDRTTVDGGIQKWSLVGGTWVLNGVIASSPALSIRGIDGVVSGTAVSLVASGNGGLYVVADNAGYNAAPSTTTLSAPIATAGTNNVFRGATFAPVAAVVIPAPTITSFTPATGPAGTTVTITGTNLTGATAVTLNGVAITGFTVVNGTTITFTVPATATTGTIAVTTPGGTVTSTGTFTFVPAASAPTVTSFTPTSGPVGTTVTVTGTNFTGATGATLNGLAVANFMVMSATSVMFDVPTGATSGLIAVTTAAGTGTSTGTFTVSAPVAIPTITSLTPNAQVVGGPAVTITIAGTGFTPTSTVNFNSVSYPQTSSTATSLVVTIPASAVATVGNYAVTVTNTAGTSNINTFTVSNPSTAGAFEDFEAGTKAAYAAAPVTLTSGVWNFSDALIGTGFSDRFNGLKSARIRVGFIAMSFDKPTGAGTVIVNAGLYGIDTGATFILEKSTDGGTTYTTVPGAPATLTATLTPYTFTVNQAGNVRFRITSTATLTTSRISIDDISISNYTAPATPTITSFTPTTGGPGTVVTVTGTNFTGATAVRIGNFNVPNFTVVSATSITFVVPAGTGSVTGVISVVTPGGTATSTATFNLVSAVLASQTLPGLSVFPNPATDRITVALPTAGAATVALRDLTGRVVLAPTTLGADKQLVLPATLARGIYLLEVKQGDVLAVRRIEKN